MKGSVVSRGKGSWRIIAYLGYDPYTGKQNRPSKTIKAENKKQAEKSLRDWINELEKGIVPGDSKMTVAQFAAEWLAKHCEGNLQPKTVHTYKEKLDGHILPVLGAVKLRDLTPKMIADFCSTLRQANQRKDKRNVDDKKLSERTVLHCYRILSAMLQVAVNWQVLAANPIRNVKPPKVERKKAPVYDKAVVQAICQAIKQEPMQYQAMIILDLFTGMRSGELLGLAWHNVDLDNGRIYVHQAAQYLPGKGTFIKQTPKNASSRRGIAIDAVVVEMLKSHRAEQQQAIAQLGDMWTDHDLVFAKGDGKPFCPNELSNWFPDFLARHNLPRMNFHALRHYNATFLLNLGVPIHDVQAHTGHARASTLLDIYGHAMQSGNELIAQKLTEEIAPHLK